MTTASPALVPAAAAVQQKPIGTLAELLDHIRQQAGVTEEDLSLLERVDRVEHEGRSWEFGKPVPLKTSQMVVYIVDDGDEIRVYSVAGPGQTEMCSRWRFRPDRAGLRRSMMTQDLFEVLVGREMTDALEGVTEVPELEEVLEYMRALPAGTSVSQALADIEAGKHQVDDDAKDGDNGAAGG